MRGPSFRALARRFLYRGGGSLLIALALALIAGEVFGIRFNATPSVPTGLYRITADVRAPYIEFCPPESVGVFSIERGYRKRMLFGCADGGEPLLKPVITGPGDTVEMSLLGISVNGVALPNTAAKRTDSAGRSILPWPSGRYLVQPNTLWVASTYDARSFDSRYFGPIQFKEVRHHMRPVWTER